MNHLGEVVATCAAAERAMVDAAPEAYPFSVRDRARWALIWMAGLVLSPDGRVRAMPRRAAFLLAAGRVDNVPGPLAAAWRQMRPFFPNLPALDSCHATQTEIEKDYEKLLEIAAL